MRPVKPACQGIAVRTIVTLAVTDNGCDDSVVQIDPANDVVFSVDDIKTVVGGPPDTPGTVERVADPTECWSDWCCQASGDSIGRGFTACTPGATR